MYFRLTCYQAFNHPGVRFGLSKKLYSRCIQIATITKQKAITMKNVTAMLLLTLIMTANPWDTFSQTNNHSCGAVNIHNPSVNYGRVTDIDGNSYKTVIIGDMVWFAENLRVTRFQNGDVIPNVSDSAAWASLTGPGMCSYRNNSSFDCPRGKLYNFFVASDTRNPCPSGWRVPLLTDLYKLIFHLDPNANPQQPGNWPNTAGGALKSSGLTYWRAPNTNASNLTGFSAIPNGGRNNAGLFSLSSDAAASYWLSTQVGPGMGFFLELAFPQDWAVRNAYFAKYGICIRCVKDRGSMDVNDNETVFIYPNPNQGVFTVRLPASLSAGTYQITLHDSKGTRVYAQSKAFANQEANFNLRKLAAGMYFITIWDNLGKELKTGKVAILR